MLIRWWSSRSRDVFLGVVFQGWILLLDGGVVFFRVDFSIGWCGFFKVGFLLDEVYLFSRV